MGIVFTQFFFEYLPASLLFFPIVWLAMRSIGGQKLKIGSIWLILGFFSTALLAAIFRFASIYVVGGKLVLAPVEGYGAFFFIAVPVLSAIGVCLFLRQMATSEIKAESA